MINIIAAFALTTVIFINIIFMKSAINKRLKERNNA
jgi:capsular polysaccharide biosynthesis protein